MSPFMAVCTHGSTEAVLAPPLPWHQYDIKQCYTRWQDHDFSGPSWHCKGACR